MYPTFIRPCYNQRTTFVPVRPRLWWLLWCLFAQVDCLNAQFTHTTIAASGYCTAGPTVSVTYAGTTWIRKQGTTTWSQRNAGTANLYTINTTAQTGTFRTTANYSAHSAGNTGFQINAPVVTEIWEFTYTNGGTPAGAFTLTIPAQTFTLQYGGPNVSNYWAALQTITVSIPVSGGGQAVVTNPNTATPTPTTLNKFFGTSINVPYFVAAGVTNVAVELNGQIYNFPVKTEPGDSGGIAMLSLPIPTNWNGVAKVNGQDVALAPRLAYTGEPTMSVTANAYQDIPDTTQPLNLSAGLTQAVPSRPSGQTETQYYGFPNGVTGQSKLTPPNGVSSVSQTAPVGGSLPTGVTYTSGAKTWVTNNYNQVSTGVLTGNGTTTTASGGTTAGTGSELTDADKDAIGEQGAVGDYGTALEAGSGLKGIGTQWDNLKVKAQNKFGAFAPLQTGALPKETALAITIPLGPFGSRSMNLDLTQPPFSTARAIAHVGLIISAGWFFLRYIKI